MDLLAAFLIAASYVGIAVALVRPRAAGAAAAILLLSAAVALAMGLLGPSARELVCRHTFVAYEGNALEPGPVHFATGTVRAPGWQWPLPWLLFAGSWAWLLWRRRARPPSGSPFVLPLALAWTATATWLALQWTAAPGPVVQPFGLDRCLWPAGLALALLLASSGQRLVPAVLSLSLGIVAARLPAALFSKYASDQRLGTGLDVSSIVAIVHPLTRTQFDPPLVAGSSAQQFWLIWAEHVFVFPAFHLLSLSGVLLLALMVRKHAAVAS
jgi:hypothetical protein